MANPPYRVSEGQLLLAAMKYEFASESKSLSCPSPWVFSTSRLVLKNPIRRSMGMFSSWDAIFSAAFLDRLDRSEAPADADDDFRVEALQRAIALLIDEKGERAKRVLELFSDPTETPIDKAPMKGADGAYKETQS